MKTLNKYHWFFGITTAWNLFWAAVSLVGASMGGVIFFGLFGVIQLSCWLYVWHNLKDTNAE